jgi:predicted DNA-binding protein (MmcQ/YjbR family)
VHIPKKMADFKVREKWYGLLSPLQKKNFYIKDKPKIFYPAEGYQPKVRTEDYNHAESRNGVLW